MSYTTFSAMNRELKKPLEYKIDKAIEAIENGFSVSKHETSIAFSGGKDSTVLWHLIRTHFPGTEPYIIFGNTGMEYPESLKFARKLGKEWGGNRFIEARPALLEKDCLKYEAQKEILEWLISTGRVREVLKADGKLKTTGALEKMATPEMMEDFRRRKLVWKAGTSMNYWYCVDQYGWPIMGKAASKLDAKRINIDCFLRFSESASQKEDLLKYYDVLRECKFSQHCCKILKKDPSERVQAELGVDVVFKGLMAAESHARALNFVSRGYCFKSSRPHLNGDPFYHVNPISIWTDDDIWEYIHKYKVPYSPLYDLSWQWKGETHYIKRNGCIGCATDILFKLNHQQALRQTHPRHWETLMRKGMAKELHNLYKTRAKGMPTIADLFSADELLDRKPCAYDVMFENIDAEGIEGEYDPELESEVKP